MTDRREFERLYAHHEAGRMGRRELIRNLAATGLTSAAIGSVLAASPLAVRQARADMAGAEQRAWAAAVEAAKAAKKKTLTFLHPTGAVGNFKPYIEKWRSIGIEMEFIEFPDDDVHGKAMQEAVAKTGRYDVMLGTTVSLPDWAESGVIHELTDWAAKYDPELDHPEHGIVEPLRNYGQYYKGKLYALFQDGDQWMLLLRDDMMKDPERQAAFKAKFGRDLAAPRTWDEYDQLVGFMHAPDKRVYGHLEYRSRYYVHWQFMQRFASKGKLYFDADMKPQFDSPEGIATLKEMIALNGSGHPDAYSFTWSSNYNAFGRGEGFANFAWPSGFKYAKAPETGPATTGKIMSVPVPGGKRPDGSVLYTPMQPFGWYYTVNKYSEIPELSYLWAQWFQSPTISADSIPYLGGYSDPFRTSHFKQPTPRLLAAYSTEFLEQSYNNVVNTIPDFVLRAGTEYADELDKEVHAAVTGSKTPEAAMRDASRGLDRITNRVGRPAQKEAWKGLVKGLAPALRKATGAETWT